MARLLIVNADDLGYTARVTSGIIRAHHEGIVTSTSVMVNMPDGPEALRIATRDTPALGLGLHLTLTAGQPVSPPETIPDLVGEDGWFRKLSDLRNTLNEIELEQTEHELRAQIAAFIQHAGKPPDHLDSHHHVTYFSVELLTLMARLAAELNAPIRRPLPDAQPVEFWMKVWGMENYEEAEESVAVLKSYLESSRVLMPDHFIPEFYAERTTLGDLLNTLTDLRDGISELMCHPGEVDSALRGSSSYTGHREHELVSLTHPAARELIHRSGIELVTFRAVMG